MGVNSQHKTDRLTTDKALMKIAVIGNGPVGVHFVNQLITRGFSGHICIFGDEDCQPYNRVLLSSFLCGEVSLEAIQNPISEHKGLVQQVNCRVVKIIPSEKQIKDEFGQSHHYDKLIMATGSKPYLPNIEGRSLKGVYCFRNMQDTLSLFARRTRSRQTLVVGGGLLGLETAKAMLKYSTKVTVLQHTPTLMNRQLDEHASQYIQLFAEKAGIQFLLSSRVVAIEGAESVQSVLLKDGQRLECDTVVFATGITPNTDLAVDAKISIRKGIQIDEHLRTNYQDIFAIGECADYNGQVYGLVAPGLEQASILASNLLGENSIYNGSTLLSELKVLGIAVFSMGKVGSEYDNQVSESWSYHQGKTNYRRVFIQQGKVVGAVSVGEWSEIKGLQQAIKAKKRLWIWHKIRFTRTGKLFPDSRSELHHLPDSTLICNCQQVTLGTIKNCVKSQEADFQLLQKKLGVSTVCGTCKPLVQQILEKPVETLPVKLFLLGIACLALLITNILLFSPQIPAATSVQQNSFNWLWTDSRARQISGFTILTLTIFSFLLSFRKRFTKLKWMSFDFWRSMHVTFTVMALLMLFVHTGISFGQGLNRWLIINFIVIALIGIGSAAVASIEGKFVSPTIKQLKRMLVLGHIITFWPLPIFLSYHILSVYYF